MLGALIHLLVALAAHGDGGVPRLSATSGPFVLTLFTAPTPLRVGGVEVTVLVQRREDDAAVLDADVVVTLRSLVDPALTRWATATRGAAANQLLYAAVLDAPAAGRWAIDVAVHAAAGDAAVSVAVDVGDALPPALAFWPYLLLPVAAIALYALREWLRARQSHHT